jgi:hypothetical protein
MESPFDVYTNTTCSMYLEPMLNTYFKTYQNVITFDQIPNGPIGNMVKPVNPPKLSVFQQTGPFEKECTYVLHRYPKGCSVKYGNCYMGISDISAVFGYLRNNGYTINMDDTKMLQRANLTGGVAENRLSGNRTLICMITYNG